MPASQYAIRREHHPAQCSCLTPESMLAIVNFTECYDTQSDVAQERSSSMWYGDASEGKYKCTKTAPIPPGHSAIEDEPLPQPADIHLSHSHYSRHATPLPLRSLHSPRHRPYLLLPSYRPLCASRNLRQRHVKCRHLRQWLESECVRLRFRTGQSESSARTKLLDLQHGCPVYAILHGR